MFDRDVKTIGKHINTVFKEGELEEKVVVAKFATTIQHGAIKNKSQTKSVAYYNLDVIISVGYRAKLRRGTQFRQWATQRLNCHHKGHNLKKHSLIKSTHRVLI